MRKSLVLICGFISLMLSSCGVSSNNDVEYFPFQSKKDGKWGMVSTDGKKVLFEDEFTNPPTLARNGRFIVKNKDGNYELYTAEENPQQVGGEYVGICNFTQSVTPAVEKGKCITLIDKDGNVKFTLDKIDGKTVTKVSAFNEYNGLATYVTAEDKVGVINTSGTNVVAAEYDEIFMCTNCILCVNKVGDGNSRSDYKYKVLSLKGEELFSFNGDKYTNFWEGLSSDYVGVAKKNGDEVKCGIINLHGDDVIRPTSKIKSIQAIRGENFIYSDGESFGVKNIKDETIIRAKYEGLIFLDNNILLAKKDKDDDFIIIDIEGKQIGNDSFKDAYYNINGTIVVKTGDTSWEFMKTDGTMVKETPDIYSANFSDGEGYVESDNFDYDAFVNQLNISADGIGDITFNMSANRINDLGNELEFPNYNSLSYTKDVLGIEASFGAQFPEEVKSYYP